MVKDVIIRKSSFLVKFSNRKYGCKVVKILYRIDYYDVKVIKRKELYFRKVIKEIKKILFC